MMLPESIAVLRVTDGAVKANDVLDRVLGFREDLKAIVAGMPAGLWPIVVDGALMAVHCFQHGNERLMIVQRTDRSAHAAFLSAMSDGILSVLFDSTGMIHSSSSSSDAPGLFDLSQLQGVSGLVAPSSLPTFWSAVAECRMMERVQPFSIDILHGGRILAMIASVRLLPGGLFLLGISPPTMDASAVTAPDSSIVETILGSVPAPAMIIDAEARIRWINRAMEALGESFGAGGITDTDIRQWVPAGDRAGLTSIHEMRLRKGFAPFRRDITIVSPSGMEIMAEVTSILMPEGDETLVFIRPSGADSSAGMEPGPVGSLARMMDEGRDQADQMRLALDLLKTGTGAGGVSVATGGRVFTSGDVPLQADSAGASEPQAEPGSERWTGTIENGFSYAVSTRLHGGMARIALYGLKSGTLSPLARFVLSLAPYLTDLAISVSAQRSIMNTASTILDTWDFMRMGDSGPEKFLARAADVTGAEAMIAWGPPGPDGALQPVVSCGVSTEPEPLNLTAETAPGWSYTHSEPAYVSDSSSDGRFSPSVRGFRSEVAVPLLRRQGRATGVLLALSRQPGAFPNPAPNLIRLISIPLSLWLFPEGRPSVDGQGKPAEDPAGRSDMEDILLSLSHRMRAPVTAMKGFCDMLASGKLGRLDEEQLDAVGSLSRSTLQVSEQVERLLSFLRLEIQHDRGEGAWGRPSEILETVLRNLEPRTAEKGIRIVTDIPQTPFTAFFERQRLEEVIWNLLDNALRHTPLGGTITVRMRGEQSSWTLDVEDTGSGIPAKSLPYVFDRFYRGDGEESQGLGIGLSIVRRFTDGMGGTINVFSREGRGSRFMLRLPVPGRQE